MQIQWYPGHMTKAKRAIEEDIRLTDLVIEMTDARIPLSGRNPDIDRLAGTKSRIMIMTKADLADEKCSALWKEYFLQRGIFTILTDVRKTDIRRQVLDAVRNVCREKIEKDRKKGIQNRPVRAIVLGIPNVGKSTFINTISRKNAAKTGNKPGVTRGNQWIHVDNGLDLLDTPGILWPKFDNQEIGRHLAFTGAVSDEVVSRSELALELLKKLKLLYPAAIKERYAVNGELSPVEQMEQIAQKRGCLKKGQEVDYERTAQVILDDFRMGKLGRITLDRVPVSETEDKKKEEAGTMLQEDQ